MTVSITFVNRASLYKSASRTTLLIVVCITANGTAWVAWVLPPCRMLSLKKATMVILVCIFRSNTYSYTTCVIKTLQVCQTEVLRDNTGVVPAQTSTAMMVEQWKNFNSGQQLCGICFVFFNFTKLFSGVTANN